MNGGLGPVEKKDVAVVDKIPLSGLWVAGIEAASALECKRVGDEELHRVFASIEPLEDAGDALIIYQAVFFFDGGDPGSFQVAIVEGFNWRGLRTATLTDLHRLGSNEQTYD